MKSISLKKQLLVSLALFFTASLIITVGDYVFVQNSVLSQSENYAGKIADHLSSLLLSQPHGEGSTGLLPQVNLTVHRRQIIALLEDFDLVNVKIFDRDGTILFSLDPAVVGRNVERNAGLLRALSGIPSSHVASPEYQELIYGSETRTTMIETYVPITNPGTGEILGAYEIYQDYLPLRSIVVTETARSSLTHIVLLLVFAFLFFRYGSMTSRLMEEERKSHILDLEDRVEERTLELKRSRRRIDNLLERTESMYRELKIADEYHKNFMGLISHELRTPLTVIKGYLNLLDEGVLRQSADDASKAVKTTLEETRHLEAIINNIIELSHLDQEKGATVSRDPIDLTELLPEAIELLRPEISEKGVQVGIDIDRTLSLFHSDRMKLLEVLHQLLSNAIKFSDPGGKVILKASGSHRGLLLSVHDEGVGIPGPQQVEIFNRFYQVDITSTRSYEGSGLGLAIVKRIAELLGGRVWVDSEEGVGSVFYFEVPERPPEEIEPEEGEGAEEGEHPSIFPSPGFRSRTILVVDDDPDYLNLLKDLLDLEGYRIHQCRDGLEALNYLYSEADQPLPSLIILDMRMPHVHGLDFCRIIRRNINTRSIPVIIVSAAALKEDVEQGIAAGANAYLTKPFEAGELIARIDFYLRGEETD
ncbi:MAG: hybrid sensor histidine kinase/response regulator [bacterium]|nr:MAG: hybrid sensor histidine kinase/response regulator [bacterium]